MAERKATNKYYPPEWNPSKGSINTFRGSHPLRERARKLDQGILVIRFELPFNVWCDGCNNHLGMGVRYNSEKSKIGMYYSTPIYQFRMKCHLCDNHFVIKTDPQNLDYIVVSGARRQERRWDPEENEQINVDKSIKKRISLDPMFKLEHEVIDKNKAISNKNTIDHLEEAQDGRWKDDYSSNCDVRKVFRSEKKKIKEIAINDSKLLKKSSLPLSLRLVPETEADIKMAKLLNLQSKHSLEQNKQLKRKEIMTQSIFDTGEPLKMKLLKSSNSNSSVSTSTSSKLKQALSNIKTKPVPNSIVNYSSDSD